MIYSQCDDLTVLTIQGKDRRTWLNGLVTNDVASRKPGQGCYAFVTNVKGRILADLTILLDGDECLAIAPAAKASELLAHFDKYLIMEDARVAHRADLAVWGLLGERAPQWMCELGWPDATTAGPLDHFAVGIDAARVLAARDDLGHHPQFLLIAPAAHADLLHQRLRDAGAADAGACGAGVSPAERGAAGTAAPQLDHATAASQARDAGSCGAGACGAGVSPAGETGAEIRPRRTPQEREAGATAAARQAMEAARIEAGRPRFGQDFDESVLPAETGQLGRAVSFSKGCYLGQEVVARMESHAAVARMIVGIKMPSPRVPPLPAEIIADDKPVGRLTSAAFSDALGCVVGLGIVRAGWTAPGTAVRVVAGGESIAAEVAGLPLV